MDVQPKMIEGLKRRAAKAGVSDRVDARLVPATTMALDGMDETVDFALVFAVVHEMPAAAPFFAEAARALKPGASLLLVEPAGHVSDGEFAAELAAAAAAGVSLAGRPQIRRCQAALLIRKAA